jgi:hypothetical protein
VTQWHLQSLLLFFLGHDFYRILIYGFDGYMPLISDCFNLLVLFKDQW